MLANAGQISPRVRYLQSSEVTVCGVLLVGALVGGRSSRRELHFTGSVWWRADRDGHKGDGAQRRRGPPRRHEPLGAELVLKPEPSASGLEHEMRVPYSAIAPSLRYKSALHFYWMRRWVGVIHLLMLCGSVSASL